MTDRVAAGRWVERYLRAWASNDPAVIGGLFTTDAVYRPTPMSKGWHGRAAIVAEWLARKDDPGTWQFAYQVLAVEGKLAVIKGVTTYAAPTPTYENLWLVRLDSVGRASDFTDYWMQRPKPRKPPKRAR